MPKLPPRQPDPPRRSDAGSIPIPSASEGPSLPAREPDPPRLTTAIAPDSAAMIAAHERAKKAWAPHLDPDVVPPGYRVRGTSILRDGDGNVRLVWHKTTNDGIDPFELGEKIAAGLASGGLVPCDTIEPPEVVCDDLLACYPIGDPHVGMYAWRDECGESFDLDIAVRQYLAATQLLLQRAPEGSDALLIELGDFFHADDPQYRTSSGNHTVDVDTRYERVVMTGIEIMRTMVDAMLTKHRNVELWCVRGNHDDRSTLTLRESLRGYYANNPRVSIDTTPGKFHFREWGANLIGATHGDTIKGKRSRTLLEVFTADQRAAWGRTKHARALVGHVHHDSVETVGALTVQTFPTLAPKDAWHTAKGYRSGRDTRLQIWHREHGLRSEQIITISEIHALMNEQYGLARTDAER